MKVPTDEVKSQLSIQQMSSMLPNPITYFAFTTQIVWPIAAMEPPATLQTPLPPAPSLPLCLGSPPHGLLFQALCWFLLLCSTSVLGARLFPRAHPLRVTSLLCHALTRVSSHGLLSELQAYITNSQWDSSAWMLTVPHNYSIPHTHTLHTCSFIGLPRFIKQHNNTPFAKRNRNLFQLSFILKIQFIIKPHQLSLQKYSILNLSSSLHSPLMTTATTTANSS